MPPRKPKADHGITCAVVERHDGDGLVLALPGYPGGTLDIHFVPHSPVARIEYAVVYAGKAGEEAAFKLVEEAKRLSKSKRAVLKVDVDVLPDSVLSRAGFVTQNDGHTFDLRAKSA